MNSNPGRWLDDNASADMALVHFSEQLLGSAIGSSSARLVLSLVLQRMDDTSSTPPGCSIRQARRSNTNQDMPAYGTLADGQGIAVFDNANNLIIWNRRFRELPGPPRGRRTGGLSAGRHRRDSCPPRDVRQDEEKALIANFLTSTSRSCSNSKARPHLEVRSNAMPTRASSRPTPT
ncbi:hypothetical protein F2981_08715 [Sinorhizobium meliloti]|nr:hypothetical protein [Sinorhizobium meliloti]